MVKFYEEKKELLDDFIKEEKKIKYEQKAIELRAKLEKQQLKEFDRATKRETKIKEKL